MKADRRLIEHVKGVDQRGTDGGRKIDSLKLSSGESPRLAIQRQIFQTHSRKITEPATNFVENQACHLIHRRGRLQFLEEIVGFAHAHSIDLSNVLPLDSKIEGCGFESCALALRAKEIGAVAGEKDPHMHPVALPLQPPKPTAHSLVFSVSFEDEFLLLFAQLHERFFFGNSFALAELHEPLESPGLRDPGFNGPFAQRLGGVGNDQIHVDVDHPAKSAASLAGPQRTVEGKKIGHRVVVGDIAMGAMEPITERLTPPIFSRKIEVKFSFAEMEGLLQRVRDSLSRLRLVCKAIHHHLKISFPLRGFLDLF